MMQPGMNLQHTAPDDLMLSNTQDINLDDDDKPNNSEDQFGSYEALLDLDGDDEAWDGDFE